MLVSRLVGSMAEMLAASMVASLVVKSVAAMGYNWVGMMVVK